MGKAITYQRFLEIQVYYYNVLKKGYLQEVAEADDKDYTGKHYQKVLFGENPMVPNGTVLFEELLISYRHLSRMKAEKGYYQTMELLEEIREISKREHLKAVSFQKGNKEIELCGWYFEQIWSRTATVEELICNEIRVQEFTDENLVGVLALKLVGKKLLKEFQTEEKLAEVKTNHRYQFTQKEQLLSITYLIESLGVNLLGQCDRTKMAALLHSIMGVPFDDKKKLKDLGIYKSLSVIPQVVKDDRVLIKYLENIRLYLQEANFHDAVSLIDKQIVRCKRELE